MTIRTSLLEARLLAGDEVLADDLLKRFRARGDQGPTPAPSSPPS